MARLRVFLSRPDSSDPQLREAPGADCGPVRDWGQLRIFGRLPGGVRRTASEAQLNAVAGHLAQASWAHENPRFTLEPEIESRFYRDLVTRARSIPRVEGASIVNAPPFGEAVGNESAWLSVDGSPETRESRFEVDTVVVGPQYFPTMGIPLLAAQPAFLAPICWRP